MIRYGKVEIINVLSLSSVIFIAAALGTTISLPKSRAGDFLLVTASIFIGLTIAGFLLSSNWLLNLGIFFTVTMISLQLMNGFVCASTQLTIANGPNA